MNVKRLKQQLCSLFSLANCPMVSWLVITLFFFSDLAIKAVTRGGGGVASRVCVAIICYFVCITNEAEILKKYGIEISE